MISNDFLSLGSWLKVEQVIGKCGGTVVRTEMLRSSYDVSTEAKNGKTLSKYTK